MAILLLLYKCKIVSLSNQKTDLTSRSKVSFSLDTSFSAPYTDYVTALIESLSSEKTDVPELLKVYKEQLPLLPPDVREFWKYLLRTHISRQGTDPLFFALVELIQNSLDAMSKQFGHRNGSVQTRKPAVYIDAFPDKGVLEVADSGGGISEKDIRFLDVPALSSNTTRVFNQSSGVQGVSGRFGLGGLVKFMFLLFDLLPDHTHTPAVSKGTTATDSHQRLTLYVRADNQYLALDFFGHAHPVKDSASITFSGEKMNPDFEESLREVISSCVPETMTVNVHHFGPASRLKTIDVVSCSDQETDIRLHYKMAPDGIEPDVVLQRGRFSDRTATGTQVRLQSPAVHYLCESDIAADLKTVFQNVRHADVFFSVNGKTVKINEIPATTVLMQGKGVTVEIPAVTSPHSHPSKCRLEIFEEGRLVKSYVTSGAVFSRLTLRFSALHLTKDRSQLNPEDPAIREFAAELTAFACATCQAKHHAGLRVLALLLNSLHPLFLTMNGVLDPVFDYLKQELTLCSDMMVMPDMPEFYSVKPADKGVLLLHPDYIKKLGLGRDFFSNSAVYFRFSDSKPPLFFKDFYFSGNVGLVADSRTFPVCEPDSEGKTEPAIFSVTEFCRHVLAAYLADKYPGKFVPADFRLSCGVEGKPSKPGQSMPHLPSANRITDNNNVSPDPVSPDSIIHHGIHPEAVHDELSDYMERYFSHAKVETIDRGSDPKYKTDVTFAANKNPAIERPISDDTKGYFLLSELLECAPEEFNSISRDKMACFAEYCRSGDFSALPLTLYHSKGIHKICIAMLTEPEVSPDRLRDMFARLAEFCEEDLDWLTDFADSVSVMPFTLLLTSFKEYCKYLCSFYRESSLRAACTKLGYADLGRITNGDRFKYFSPEIFGHSSLSQQVIMKIKSANILNARVLIPLWLVSMTFWQDLKYLLSLKDETFLRYFVGLTDYLGAYGYIAPTGFRQMDYEVADQLISVAEKCFSYSVPAVPSFDTLSPVSRTLNVFYQLIKFQQLLKERFHKGLDVRFKDAAYALIFHLLQAKDPDAYLSCLHGQVLNCNKTLKDLPPHYKEHLADVLTLLEHYQVLGEDLRVVVYMILGLSQPGIFMAHLDSPRQFGAFTPLEDHPYVNRFCRNRLLTKRFIKLSMDKHSQPFFFLWHLLRKSAGEGATRADIYICSDFNQHPVIVFKVNSTGNVMAKATQFGELVMPFLPSEEGDRDILSVFQTTMAYRCAVTIHDKDGIHCMLLQKTEDQSGLMYAVAENVPPLSPRDLSHFCEPAEPGTSYVITLQPDARLRAAFFSGMIYGEVVRYCRYVDASVMKVFVNGRELSVPADQPPGLLTVDVPYTEGGVDRGRIITRIGWDNMLYRNGFPVEEMGQTYTETLPDILRQFIRKEGAGFVVLAPAFRQLEDGVTPLYPEFRLMVSYSVLKLTLRYLLHALIHGNTYKDLLNRFFWDFQRFKFFCSEPHVKKMVEYVLGGLAYSFPKSDLPFLNAAKNVIAALYQKLAGFSLAYGGLSTEKAEDAVRHLSEEMHASVSTHLLTVWMEKAGACLNSVDILTLVLIHMPIDGDGTTLYRLKEDLKALLCTEGILGSDNGYTALAHSRSFTENEVRSMIEKCERIRRFPDIATRFTKDIHRELTELFHQRCPVDIHEGTRKQLGDFLKAMAARIWNKPLEVAFVTELTENFVAQAAFGTTKLTVNYSSNLVLFQQFIEALAETGGKSRTAFVAENMAMLSSWVETLAHEYVHMMWYSPNHDAQFFARLEGEIQQLVARGEEIAAVIMAFFAPQEA